MTKRERDRVAALERRRAHLAERLEFWAHGDPSRTRLELAALDWALEVIRFADGEGLLDDLAGR